MENGLQPHYADITRGDLNIPVVRAMVPGLELMYDFDQFSRLSPRLFANYLGLFA
jgi:ribosomal protein S12 methylthiotransferase accessory factor YcaO